MALQEMIAKQAIEMISKLSQRAWKTASSHVQRNVGKYAAGVILVAGAGGKFLYDWGNKKGHTEGRKDGIAEQAKKDEAKIQRQHDQHESDRRKWNEEKQAFEDLIVEVKK
jgi:hypothetical protein